MSATVKFLSVFTLIFFVCIGSMSIAFISFNNTEVALRTQYEAKIDANKADFDNTWKTISQVAQVPAQYKNDFKDIYTSIMEGRYKNDHGQLMNWIQEQNPTFDSSLYAKVQVVVEAKRESWTTRQKELRDIKREHDQLLRQFPGAFYNMFLGRKELEVVLVTSEKTEEAFTLGQDNNTQLFEKK